MRLVGLLTLAALATPAEARWVALGVKGRSGSVQPLTVDQPGLGSEHSRFGSENTTTTTDRALTPLGGLASSSDSKTSSTSSSSLRAQRRSSGATVCQCICGGQTVWHRELFTGNVEAEKEKYCKDDLCPRVMVPGLKVTSQCTFHADAEEVEGGTVCGCDCGSKRLWHQKVFYGDVVEEKEKECVEEICPRHAVPGLKFSADCTYKRRLFAKDSAAIRITPHALLLSALIAVSGYARL